MMKIVLLSVLAVTCLSLPQGYEAPSHDFSSSSGGFGGSSEEFNSFGSGRGGSFGGFDSLNGGKGSSGGSFGGSAGIHSGSGGFGGSRAGAGRLGGSGGGFRGHGGSGGSLSGVSGRYGGKQGPVVPILVDNREGPVDGEYSFEFETGNGISRQEQGAPNGPYGAVTQQGGWSFTHPDGTPAQFSFVADEEGFKVESPLLPTAPPAPYHALAQIEKAEREAAQGIVHDGSYSDDGGRAQGFGRGQGRFGGAQKGFGGARQGFGGGRQGGFGGAGQGLGGGQQGFGSQIQKPSQTYGF